MADDEFKLNYRGMGEYLRGPEMLEMVSKRGEAVKATAEALAPVYTGEYKTRFGMRVGVREGAHPRACATVYNDSDHAFDVEFGRGPTPRHRTLGKALGAAG